MECSASHADEGPAHVLIRISTACFMDSFCSQFSGISSLSRYFVCTLWCCSPVLFFVLVAVFLGGGD
jgi:hypothetical protein